MRARKLRRPNLRRVEERLGRVLEGFSQVAGAYLFGSSLDHCRPESDVDVGLVLMPSCLGDSESDLLAAEISLALKRLDGRAVDIVILNRCNPIFAFRVLSRGRLVFVRDADVLGSFIECTSRAYAEIYPRYRHALEAAAKGV